MVGVTSVVVDVTATGNSNSALCIANSNVTFTGATRITGNTGRYGGGVNSKDSILLFTDHIEVSYNVPSSTWCIWQYILTLWAGKLSNSAH